MKIPILYRDDSLIVCIKRSGMDSETDMPAALAAQADEALCVHRLDRAVGGVMVYARRPDAAAALSRAIADGQFSKAYLAVVRGRPESVAGVLRDLLFYDRKRGKSFVVTRKRAGVREAVLRYRTLAEAEGLSLLSVCPETGRTHQIRVQFASRQLPLLGDRRYGSPQRDCPVALWSRALSFPHPYSGAPLRFEALPEGFPWDRFPENSYQTGDWTCVTSK